MNGDPLSGDGIHGERFQASRPGGNGLFWPTDRHLFRRRRLSGSLRAGLAMALVVAACAAGYAVLITA